MNKELMAISVIIGCSVLLSSLSTGSVLVSGGKYNSVELRNQYFQCSDSSCDGCMAEYWPGLLPIFDENNEENCNGIVSSLPFTVTIPMGEWTNFILLYTTKDDLQATVSACGQAYEPGNIKCYFLVGTEWVDVRGAYLLGSEINLGSLDVYIDRSDTGFPTASTLDPWGDLSNYVMAARDNLNLESTWETVFYGALAYYEDLTSASNGIPAKSVLDEEFAKKVIVHSFICWQDPEWDYGSAYNDIISDTGLSGWPFIVDETPTFVFQISNEMSDIFYVPVVPQAISWGRTKAIYR